ncbi:MAG: immune inhibitor A, partial [Anaerolineae bacterium]|nr:immune inhibitor A [Anaerolineae bacterium]
GDRLIMTLDMSETAPLVQTDPHSGERFWYSNRADVSHTRLYRQFDLSDVTSATFTYQLWADLEPDWDYGYLLISTDDGVSWQTIQTETMTTTNPVGNRYGDAAYSLSTGRWIKEQVILDAYVGGEIWLSFELITDDAVNYSGMVIDDVALPEIGYYSDFEMDDGGWISEGWAWVTNHVPQQAWLQVVQRLPDSVIVHKWFAPSWEISPVTIDNRTQAVFIAISPIAQVTTVPVEYNLTIRLDN